MLYAFYFFVATDTHILLADACFEETAELSHCPTLVLQHLHREFGPFKHRRIYFRDALMCFREIKHKDGTFIGFAEATQPQQLYFARLIERHALFDARLMTNL